MMTTERVAGIATVALGVGFVGGVWFIASGVGFRLIPTPTVAPAGAAPGRQRPAARSAPLVTAVAVPEPANFTGGSGGLGPRADRADLLPAPGCDWAIEPRPFRLGGQWHSTTLDRALGGYPAIDPANGGLRYLLIQSTRQGESAINLRPVFFDAEANRQVPRRAGGGSSRGSGGEFSMSEFHLDPDRQFTPAKVAYFGIERVASDAARLLVEAAQREAKEKGMAILPPPRLGAPYPFDLPTVDGRRLRSGDLRGKVVLVAVWGPDGMSRIGLMTVKKVREDNKGDDLAIVGISFDGSAEDARGAFAKTCSDGPLVVIPNQATARRIWSDGAQIDHLPMFFLVDREGVLRFNCRAFDLQGCIDTLFGRPKRSPFSKSIRVFKPAPRAPRAPTGGPTPPPGSSPAPRPGA